MSCLCCLGSGLDSHSVSFSRRPWARLALTLYQEGGVPRLSSSIIVWHIEQETMSVGSLSFSLSMSLLLSVSLPTYF